MPTATFNGVVVAQSDDTVVVEGNHYFPQESVVWDFFTESAARQTICPWKGVAAYYDLQIGGDSAPAVAWTYHDPKPAAEQIRDHVAFYPKVRVSS